MCVQCVCVLLCEGGCLLWWKSEGNLGCLSEVGSFLCMAGSLASLPGVSLVSVPISVQETWNADVWLLHSPRWGSEDVSSALLLCSKCFYPLSRPQPESQPSTAGYFVFRQGLLCSPGWLGTHTASLLSQSTGIKGMFPPHPAFQLKIHYGP